MKFSEPFLHSPACAPDWSAVPFRPVACVLGLPFDVVDMAQAVERVQSEPAGSGAILSTPNVNWVMLAAEHAWLRDSVLRSRLSVVDGTLLVWLGRLTGVDFPERVSGSDLFAHLEHAPQATRVFFFGGMGDVAERAARALQPRRGSLEGVGGLNPGTGNVEAMSAVPLIERVRAAAPSLVVVSLGALRGQAWVVRNHHALGATWVTHLGAVVNFVAGEVKRAPAWVGKAGIEWLWRIKEEPKLWKRYATDGLRLLGLTATRVAPLMFWQRWHAPSLRSRPAQWQAEDGQRPRMLGAWGDADARAAHEALARLAAGSTAGVIEIDLSQADFLSPAVAGQLLAWQGYLMEAGRTLKLVAASAAARRLLRGYGAEWLLAGSRNGLPPLSTVSAAAR